MEEFIGPECRPSGGPDGQKRCARCKTTKSLDDFYKDASRPDGKQTWCKSCRKGLYQDKQEEYRSYAKKYRAEHPEKRHAWTGLTKEEKAAYDRKRRAENPHIAWEESYLRRAIRLGVTPVIESFTRDELTAAHGDVCVDCGGEWNEVEHVIPIVAGGAHTVENCRPICHDDNHKRWVEYQRKAIVFYAEAIRNGTI